MRKKEIDIVIESDIDLTTLSSRRVTFTRLSDNQYRVTSTLRFYSCERHAFISQYLQSKKPGLKSIKGNCSAPKGYFWES